MTTLGYRWRLREIMALKGMFQTTDLGPLLAERGVDLSDTQVYRLVVQGPERLSLRTLAALCDALSCTPDDLIELQQVSVPIRKTATLGGRSAPKNLRPTRARIISDGK
jgi:DNA-binding Xre family transcriptional regulator